MTPSFQHSAHGPPRSGPPRASGPAAVRRRHATGLRALLLGALWVMALAVLAKFSGAFKEVVLASRLGTSVMVDHFVLAFTLASWPGALLASVLTVSVTPVLARARADNATALQPFIGQVWGATLLLATAVALAVAVALPWLIGPAAAAHGAVNALIGGVAWLGCLCAAGGVVLMSFQRQIGILLEGLPSLVLGGALLLVVAIDELTLPMALMLGMVLQLACLVWAHVRTVGPVVLLWPRPGPLWSQVLGGMSYVVAGYGVMSLGPMIELALVGRFDAGSVASLGYASRITALACGLVAVAVNRVAITHFCAQTGEAAEHGWVRVMAVFAAGAAALSAGLIVLAPEVVGLIYQRGEFGPEATLAVTALMRWHVAQLAPYVATMVLCALLSARGQFAQVFVACVVCFAARAACAAWGAHAMRLDTIAASALVGHLAMWAYLLYAASARRQPAAVAKALAVAAAPTAGAGSPP